MKKYIVTAASPNDDNRRRQYLSFEISSTGKVSTRLFMKSDKATLFNNDIQAEDAAEYAKRYWPNVNVEEIKVNIFEIAE